MGERQGKLPDWVCEGVNRFRPGRTTEKFSLHHWAAFFAGGAIGYSTYLKPKEQALKKITGTDSFTGKIQTLWRNGGLKLPIRPTDYSKAKWSKTVVDVLHKDLPEPFGQYQIIYQLNDGGIVGKPEVIKL